MRIVIITLLLLSLGIAIGQDVATPVPPISIVPLSSGLTSPITTASIPITTAPATTDQSVIPTSATDVSSTTPISESSSTSSSSSAAASTTSAANDTLPYQQCLDFTRQCRDVVCAFQNYTASCVGNGTCQCFGQMARSGAWKYGIEWSLLTIAILFILQ